MGAMKIIFLDIDGVLNSTRFFEGPEFGYGPGAGLEFGASQIDPQAVEQLNNLIASTGAKVVLSTSWRHIWDKSEIARMLKQKGFQHPHSIIDITPSSMKPRGDEIEEWLDLEDERRRIEPGRSDISFVIIDDSDEFHSSDLRERFVQTDPNVGLSDEDVSRAMSILGV